MFYIPNPFPYKLTMELTFANTTRSLVHIPTLQPTPLLLVCVLQCVAVCCSGLQWVPVGSSGFQWVPVGSSGFSGLQLKPLLPVRVLQCVVVCCSVFLCVVADASAAGMCIAVYCCVLQCVAVCLQLTPLLPVCVLQCSVVCCSVLLFVAQLTLCCHYVLVMTHSHV